MNHEWGDMSDNLGLVALARIQALEARPQAEAFRAKWLAGQILDETGAIAWLRRELGADDVTSEFELDYDHFTAEVDELERTNWRAESESRGHTRFCAGRSIAADELAAVCLGWVERYSWPSTAAPVFALADAQPVIEAVESSWSPQYTAGFVLGPLSGIITLTCRPQATVADVTRAYQEAQRQLRMDVLSPRERTKPMTSPRRVDLAVMGGRIYFEEFASWAAAMAAYNVEHEDGAENPDPTYAPPNQKGRFRKDVRDSFKQATGLDLDFQPDRRGGPPRASQAFKNGTWALGRVAVNARRRVNSDG